jgi:hypothetical protein
MARELWYAGPNGILSTVVGDLRLVVQAPEQVGGTARFQVLRQGHGDKPDALVGSGHGADVSAAMAAAERMAERCVQKIPS